MGHTYIFVLGILIIILNYASIVSKFILNFKRKTELWIWLNSDGCQLKLNLVTNPSFSNFIYLGSFYVRYIHTYSDWSRKSNNSFKLKIYIYLRYSLCSILLTYMNAQTKPAFRHYKHYSKNKPDLLTWWSLFPQNHKYKTITTFIFFLT